MGFVLLTLALVRASETIPFWNLYMVKFGPFCCCGTVPSVWDETGEGIGTTVRPKQHAPLTDFSICDNFAVIVFYALALVFFFLT